MAGKVNVFPVTNSKDLNDFIRFPWKVYSNNPNWVPPLISNMKKVLDPEHNPFFKHADQQYFLAKRDEETVGRIAVVIDYNFIAFHEEKAGFVGYFDSINEYEVASALFSTSFEWLKERGMDIMRGPVNLSPNNEIGLLIDNFDTPPVIMMTYNPEYYIGFFEKYGFEKAMDLYAYFRDKAEFNERMVKIAETVKQREGISIRTVNMKEFDSEVEIVKEIYNAAWEKNWGFVPWTEEEFDFIAKDLKQIIDPDFVYIVEVEGKPVAFSLALPDINQVLKRINGKITPFNFLKVLWYSKKIDHLRVAILGILKEYRRTGLSALLYYETYKRGLAKGYKSGEMSWILENNIPVNKDLVRTGSKIYKTYRVFDKRIK